MSGKTDPLAVFHNSDSLLDAKTKAWNDTSITLKNIQNLLGGSSDEINVFMVIFSSAFYRAICFLNFPFILNILFHFLEKLPR